MAHLSRLSGISTPVVLGIAPLSLRAPCADLHRKLLRSGPWSPAAYRARAR